MLKKTILYSAILFCLIALGLQSCYKEKFDFKNLNDTVALSPNIGIPIAYGSLSLSDLIKKNSKYISDSIDPVGDKIIELVFDSVFQTYKASQFLQSPQIGSLVKRFALGNVKVADQQSDANITFNNLLTDNFSTTIQNYYIGIAGTKTDATGPNNYTPNNTSYSINKFGNLAWVYALTGTVSITVTNNYAVPIQFRMLLQTDLSIVNKGVVNTDVWIAPGASATRSQNVTSQYISNLIMYKFTNLSLNAQNGATVNMNDQLLINCQLANLTASGGKVSSAQAISIDSTIWFSINTYKGKKITQMDVYSGILDYDINSQVAGLSITATMPYVKKNGIPLVTTQNTIVGTTSRQINLAGYSMDLSQKDSVNPVTPWNSLKSKFL